MTALVTVMREVRLRVMGPMTDGTCSWPSVETVTPWYGSRVLCSLVSELCSVLKMCEFKAAYTRFESIQTVHV